MTPNPTMRGILHHPIQGPVSGLILRASRATLRARPRRWDRSSSVRGGGKGHSSLSPAQGPRQGLSSVLRPGSLCRDRRCRKWLSPSTTQAWAEASHRTIAGQHCPPGLSATHWATGSRAGPRAPLCPQLPSCAVGCSLGTMSKVNTHTGLRSHPKSLSRAHYGYLHDPIPVVTRGDLEECEEGHAEVGEGGVPAQALTGVVLAALCGVGMGK